MPTNLNPIEFLKLNPQIDGDMLATSRELLLKLRSNGLRGRGYRLAIPFSGRHIPSNRGGKDHGAEWRARRNWP